MMDKELFYKLLHLKKAVDGTLINLKNINLIKKGIDSNGMTHYESDGAPQLDIDRCQIAVSGMAEVLDDIIDKQETSPEVSYKAEVFDLISSRPIPGVESIEVNESQKKFVVHYNNQGEPEPVIMRKEEKTYTFDDIKEAWYGFLEHSGGPWGRNFPDFLYGYAFGEPETPKGTIL